MDVVLLSRLQFAAATMFHFLFVPLTLGLSVLVAMMETRYAKTGDETWLRMTRFFGKLFLINVALGVVTGITLEFQFGTNWSRYSEYVGDIFGSLLAIEATAAFFLESTFIGIWIFGWKKLSARAHANVMWLVALAGSLSSVWILIANAWMQHPVGYVIRNGRAELADFMAVATQKYALLEISHTLSAAYLYSAFVVMGISAYHLLKKQNVELFTRAFRLALIFGVISAAVVAISGDMHGVNVTHTQPAKLAAMESHWETTTRAPSFILAIPDEKNERNLIEFGRIPGLLSFLGKHDFNAEIIGLNDIPKDERPPVLITSLAFRAMVGSATLMIFLTFWAFIKRNKLLESPKLLTAIVFAIPLPLLTIEAGWVLTEVGRQPWIVYGLMKTSQAASPIASVQVLGSLIGFVVVYSILGVAGFWLMIKHARTGPEPAREASV
ncbi:cytochrome ubiquinol oxidase subunit I [Desulfoluna sp.]|uniref:cytochrome ubiquinol oxidase subunit I n=1 Tax=Desulfoluna sp. TaxID=2045199 RepID=UPI00262BC4EF|nr:cytochrome ubiquinol oxidase subunit I [Desulfoluna sp.]